MLSIINSALVKFTDLSKITRMHAIILTEEIRLMLTDAIHAANFQ